MQDKTSQIQRPQIFGITRVSFLVSDIEKSREFYGNFLGFTKFTTYRDNTGKLISVNFKVSDRQYIELVTGLLPEQADRLNYISFETADVKAMRKYLRSKGIEVHDENIPGKDSNSYITVHDPEGHTIEFVQITNGSEQSASDGKYLNSGRISDRITHAGIIVKDAAKADKFYRDILGFTEIWRGGGTESSPNWINLRIPESTDYIEYMMVGEEVTAQRLHSAHHFCLKVPDIQTALETLRSREFGFEIAPPRIGFNNKWLMNIFDPDGTRVELMEPHTTR